MNRMKTLLQPKVIVVIVAIAALIAVGHYFHLGEVFSAMLDRIRSLGALAPVLFIILYIVGAVLFVPGSILTIGAGVLFGLLWGSIYVSIGATIGATAAFLIGRYLARDWVRGQLEGNRKFAAIDQAVGREGWKIVLMTRLSPVFPFNLLNYAFGLTAVTSARLLSGDMDRHHAGQRAVRVHRLARRHARGILGVASDARPMGAQNRRPRGNAGSCDLRGPDRLARAERKR